MQVAQGMNCFAALAAVVVSGMFWLAYRTLICAVPEAPRAGELQSAVADSFRDVASLPDRPPPQGSQSTQHLSGRRPHIHTPPSRAQQSAGVPLGPVGSSELINRMSEGRSRGGGTAASSSTNPVYGGDAMR